MFRKVRDLPGGRGPRALYRCTKGIHFEHTRRIRSEDGDYDKDIYVTTKRKTFHVVVSTSSMMGLETLVFPSNKTGRIVSFGEIEGERETADHEKVIGYLAERLAKEDK